MFSLLGHRPSDPRVLGNTKKRWLACLPIHLSRLPPYKSFRRSAQHRNFTQSVGKDIRAGGSFSRCSWEARRRGKCQMPIWISGRIVVHKNKKKSTCWLSPYRSKGVGTESSFFFVSDFFKSTVLLACGVPFHDILTSLLQVCRNWVKDAQLAWTSLVVGSTSSSFMFWVEGISVNVYLVCASHAEHIYIYS